MPATGARHSPARPESAARAWRFWRRPQGSWRSGASDGAGPAGGRLDSAFSAAVIATTTAAAAAGAAAVEGVGATTITAAVAAVFPAAGPGAPVTAAAIAATAAAVTTPFTAAVATATAIPTAAGTTPTAATTAARAGLGLVDAQRPAHQLSTLERIDGPGLGFGIGHLDEGEATLATGVALEGKGAVHHLAIRGEEFNDVLLLGAEGKIADENAH